MRGDRPGVPGEDIDRGLHEARVEGAGDLEFPGEEDFILLRLLHHEGCKDLDGIAFDLTDEPQSRALGSATPVDGVKASKEASPPTESVDDGIDFEFDSVSPAKGSEVPLKSDEKGDGVADQDDPVDPDSDLELLRADPPEGEILVAEDDDPVARLDIAEAYLQIGDVEAAREILEALDGHQDEEVRSRRQALVDRL